MYKSRVAMESVPLEEALERWFSELEFKKAAEPREPEEIRVEHSMGRVTAFPVTAVISSPHYYSAAIDGMAVSSTTTFGASNENPKELKIGKEAIFIDNGRPIPDGFDAVIPLLKIQLKSNEVVMINEPVDAWENVSPAGEDVAAREVILPQNHRIRSLDVGAVLAGGVEKIKVRKKPRIGIIPVGSQLVSPGKSPEVGQMIESSSYILGNSVNELGAMGHTYPIVPEDQEFLKLAFESSIDESDIILVIAGSHLGTGLVAKVISGIGDLIIYGVNIKPGQSVCMGLIKGKPVFGLPEYAVSTFLSFHIFARPVILGMLGLPDMVRPVARVKLACDAASPLGLTEFLRVKMGRIGKDYVAVPISRGAALLMSLVRADGFVRVEADCDILKKGQEIDVRVIRNIEDIEHHLIVMGTHDICLDILRNIILLKCPQIDLYSLNVGSMEGLDAVKKNYAHIAGIHLFDTESGEYNVPFVKKIFAGTPVTVVNLFSRYLGLIVKHGNPRNIKTLNDLSREEVIFMNRIKGSGTRALFDYHLQKENIKPLSINGYDKESANHMTLAASIASGTADAGIGIMAAAKALKLDFIPVIKERLDIVIPRRFMGNYSIKCLMSAIGSSEFKNEVDALGGYDSSDSGNVIYEG
ncbi:MAG: molybdopterin biosynthesis protein [Firmicutes bacterium]|nr:molybdopterin biosynthesis protein [Bacillota bacterium]